MSTYTINSTGVYRSTDGTESIQWLAGTVIDLTTAVKFGLPGAEAQLAAEQAAAAAAAYARESDVATVTPGPGEIVVGGADGTTTRRIPTLQRGNRCVFFGDSITKGDEAEYDTTGDTFNRNEGGGRCYYTYAIMASGGGIRPLAPSAANRPRHNQGHSGYRSDQLLPLVPALVALGADYCFVLAGANDAGQGVALTTYQANMTAILDQLRASSTVPIVLSVPPNNTLATAQLANRYNAWLQHYCAAHGLRYVDVWPATANVANGQWKAANYHIGDGTHPAFLGAKAMGEAVAAAVADLFPVAPYLTSAANDAINLFTNGVFTGDANGDGVADGWSKSGGATITTSLAAADVGNWQTVSGTGDSATGSVWQNATTGFAVGDTIAIAGRVAATGITLGAATNGPSLYVQFNGTSEHMDPIWSIGCDLDAGTFYREGVVPAGTTGIRLFINWPVSGVAGSLKVARATLLNLTTLGLA